MLKIQLTEYVAKFLAARNTTHIDGTFVWGTSLVEFALWNGDIEAIFRRITISVRHLSIPGSTITPFDYS